MKSGSSIHIDREKMIVDAYFDAESSYWNELYQQNDVFGIIHQQRRTMAMKYFDELSLPKESRILEVGCGAGLTTVDLAQRGYTIEAIDRVKIMIDLTCHNALKYGVENRVKANVGDIYHLAFPDNTFGCVISLGVTPWLTDLNAALREIYRVLVPGGYTIINGDNRFRLNHLLDPAHMPALAGLKEKLKRLVEKRGLRKPSNEPRCYMYTIKEFNHALAPAGLAAIKYSMIGFGPFSFLKFQLFPNSTGAKLHNFLQRFADRGCAGLRSTGSQFLVLAKKI